MSRPVFHLLPNAHLDPVWLWDWREGLNEGITTVQTILNLMDEFPDLTFIRGEAAIYEHIQREAPDIFKRVSNYVQAGRWDVVGGTYIQPDTNLISTEVLCRQFERGMNYFRENLGVTPRIAWQADSFGHTPGLPNVFSSFGIEGFAFTRPQREQFPLDSPAFWWEGDWKNRVLCYRQHWPWYCSERGNLHEILTTTLEGSKRQGFQNVGVLLGLGNHGGGPSRRHLQDIEEWRQAHPEVEVRYSTLHRLFDALKAEISQPDAPEIPSLKGELGYCLRGCYSSLQKFKSSYRKAENLMVKAETAQSLIGGGTPAPLASAWDALLFNAFHDILPGSSIERAFDEQIEWMGGALHDAQSAQFAALNRLGRQIDTTVPPARGVDLPCDVPILLWNPLPTKFDGLVEVEASLDYRPIYAYTGRPKDLPVVAYGPKGKSLNVQAIATEHSIMPDTPWRARMLAQVQIPAWGWTLVRVGWRDQSTPSQGMCSAKSKSGHSITNGAWTVGAANGKLRVTKDGRALFGAKKGMSLQVVEDPWGSWGGMAEERESFCLENVVETWTLANSAVLEEGPLRAKLWTRWEGENSWIELTFIVADGTPHLRCEARLLWNERSRRLKLVLPSRGQVECDISGSRVQRNVEGQVPIGRWVTRSLDGQVLGFASDALSDMDATEKEVRITLARATRYADDVRTSPTERPWQPAVDSGELRFQFCLFDGEVDAGRVVDSLIFPPTALIVPASPGPLATQGSFGEISSPDIKVLSVQRIDSRTLKVRLHNTSTRTRAVKLRLRKKTTVLGKLAPQQIESFQINEELSLIHI